jgi:hypothetical protein
MQLQRIKKKPRIIMRRAEYRMCHPDTGICLGCGDVVKGVEPLLVGGWCAVCNENKVSGLELLMVAGCVVYVEDEPQAERQDNSSKSEEYCV